MEHYVTLFNGLFLPQGLALHASMERHAGSYTLWILCVDERAHEVLASLSLPNTRLIRLSDVEPPELKAVKTGRTIAEYCWTLTPFAPRFVFEADSSVTRVTYLDADMYFLKPPGALFDELHGSGKAVLITDHAYAPEYDFSATSGRFCVQFMIFVRGRGEVVRKWWEQRCIEWCFARIEDGKFGDQKYLDDWPTRFGEQVHVLKDERLLLAPWNATRFPCELAVAFHFHGLRWLGNGHVLLTDSYRLPRPVREYVYSAYLKDLGKIVARLANQGTVPLPQDQLGHWRSFKGWLRGIKNQRVFRSSVIVEKLT